MDVNGSRYHALVTRADWEALLAGEEHAARALTWQEEEGCAPGGFGLQAQLYEFKAGKPAEDAPLPADEAGGSGGVFDAWGNLYALADDRRGIRIRSAGSGVLSDFWPVGGPADDAVAAVAGLREGLRRARPGSQGDGGFRPQVPQAAEAALRLDALTVTRGHYLVVASAVAGGLLIFDLHGAGPPLFQPWPGLGRQPGEAPRAAPAVVEALLAFDDGGIGALVEGWLWRLGADLRPREAVTGGPAFQAAGAPPPAAAAVEDCPCPCRMDLRPALLAVPDGGPEEAGDDEVAVGAVALLRGERLLVTGRRRRGGVWAAVAGVLAADGRVLPLLDDRGAGSVPAAPLDSLVAEAVAPALVEASPGVYLAQREVPQLAFRPLAVEYAAAGSADAPFHFVVLPRSGDQAFRFSGHWRDGGLAIAIRRDYLPMRRYQGGGLAALPAGLRLQAYPAASLFHATQERWVPLLVLPQPRHRREASVVGPPWDSGIAGCVWHRIVLDLRLPPGTSISIETRAAEDPADLPASPWLPEPGPLRLPGGSELPWRATADAREGAFGSFGTLLQAAHGRWLQWRLTLRGDGRQTPLLRSLRAWFPRFSYAREYLPPVYRSDPASADFLERFLALFEGEFTRWEERIAAAQWLFDARTAPGEHLEWLAGWVGLACDPSLDETRRRLLIRHAFTAHARRGTVPGLLLSATLAWEPVAEEDWLRAPEKLATRPHGLRLQELFGLLPALPPGAWSPQGHTRAQLLARLDGDAGLVDLPAEDAAAAPRRARLLRALGFLPRSAAEEQGLWNAWAQARQAGAQEPPLPDDEAADAAGRQAWDDYLAASLPCAPLRRRWQDFLARRWRRISALNAAWGSSWRGFERIPLPVRLPAADAALADWHRFEARVLRGLAGAHRFRIVLPLPDGPLDLDDLARRRDAVLRVVAAEKPAHTVAEVRFGFDLFRVGEARLGLDTRLEAGLARRPELAALGWGKGSFAPAVVGRIDLGGARLAPHRPQPPADRIGLDRG